MEGMYIESNNMGAGTANFSNYYQLDNERGKFITSGWNHCWRRNLYGIPPIYNNNDDI